MFYVIVRISDVYVLRLRVLKLRLRYVLCDVYVMKTWNTPVTKGDSALLCYLDKIAGGRSTFVLIFKS